MTTAKLPRINNYRAVTEIAEKFSQEYLETPDGAKDCAEMKKLYPRMDEEFVKMYVRDRAALELRRMLWKVMDAEKAKTARRIGMAVNIAIVLVVYLIGHFIF